MRIEMEGLHKPDEDKNADVLNPEQSLGTELSRKERRLREKEKIKGMGFKKKLEYIWMYYKPTMVAILALIAAAKFGMDWYHNYKMVSVLSISAVNSGMVESESISNEIKELLGCAEDEYSAIDIASNLTTNQDATEFDYNAQMAYVTQIQTSSIDVLIFPEPLYASADNGEAFSDLTEVLDEETKAALGDRLKVDYIALETEVLEEDFGVHYEPVCLAIPFNAKNPENAAKWIASLVKE